MVTRIQQYLPLLAFILLSEGAGTLGSIFTAQAIPTWYQTLTQPSFAPPNEVFAPVWSALYLLMGIGAYLVWRTKNKGMRRRALTLFFVQLLCNTLWSIIFFGFHDISLALVEIAILWILILATMIAFVPLSRTAAFLMFPYLLWVTFASYLNYVFWILNP